MAIEHSFPKDPLQILYSSISFLQRWRLLLKSTDQDEMVEILGKFQARARLPRPREDRISDIEGL
jgi:hypothetical protein